MGFQVNYDTNGFKREIDGFLDGIMDLFMASKGVALSARKVGSIVIKLMRFDHEMDAFARNCGEAGETTVANYWAAKALAYGMAGRAPEGRGFLDKSRQRRTGGAFAEWCQTYYKTS
jgi:hypothetical protein